MQLYVMPADLRAALLDYLERQPYRKVKKLIAGVGMLPALSNAPEPPNPPEPPNQAAAQAEPAPAAEAQDAEARP